MKGNYMDIRLPEPDRKGTVPLETAVAARRSCRNFTPEPVSTRDLGQLLWAAQGTDRTSRFRNAPSAGAVYPFQLYAVTVQGLYLYNSATHSMELINESDLRTKLASASLSQAFIVKAPVTLALVADFNAITERYGGRGVRYVYIEAGHIAQNIFLQAQTIGLACVSIGAFDDSSLAQVLSLDPGLQPIYTISAGHRAG